MVAVAVRVGDLPLADVERWAEVRLLVAAARATAAGRALTLTEAVQATALPAALVGELFDQLARRGAVRVARDGLGAPCFALAEPADGRADPVPARPGRGPGRAAAPRDPLAAPARARTDPPRLRALPGREDGAGAGRAPATRAPVRPSAPLDGTPSSRAVAAELRRTFLRVFGTEPNVAWLMRQRKRAAELGLDLQQVLRELAGARPTGNPQAYLSAVLERRAGPDPCRRPCTPRLPE